MTLSLLLRENVKYNNSAYLELKPSMCVTGIIGLSINRLLKWKHIRVILTGALERAYLLLHNGLLRLIPPGRTVGSWCSLLFLDERRNAYRGSLQSVIYNRVTGHRFHSYNAAYVEHCVYLSVESVPILQWIERCEGLLRGCWTRTALIPWATRSPCETVPNPRKPF